MTGVYLDINFIAFLVSSVLAFLLGMVWYHPKVMGTKWAEARGKKLEDLDTGPLPLIASFFLWLLAACFYAFLAEFLGVDSEAGYICLACLLWVAFSMPSSLIGALYTGYPFEAVAIDTSYLLGGYYIFAIVHIAFLYI